MRHSTPFPFFDRARKLRFDVNALCDLEATLGQSVGAAFTDGKAGISTLRALLWAGLKWEEPSLTEKKVGEFLQTYLENGGTVDQIADVVGKAMIDSGIVGKSKAEGESADAENPRGETVVISAK